MGKVIGRFCSGDDVLPAGEEASDLVPVVTTYKPAANGMFFDFDTQTFYAESCVWIETRGEGWRRLD